MARKSVPYVVGAKPAEAKKILEGFGVKLIDRQGRNVNQADALVVVDQAPIAGASIDTELGVTLVVDTSSS